VLDLAGGVVVGEIASGSPAGMVWAHPGKIQRTLRLRKDAGVLAGPTPPRPAPWEGRGRRSVGG
jgi:hypothetical protein